MRTRFVPLLLATGLLRADGLADLRNALTHMNGQAPIRAAVDYQFWNRTGDAKKPIITEGRASCLVEDGPQGLQMSWSRPLLQAALQEARAQAKDPEQKAPTREAIEGLKAIEVSDDLNGAEEFLRTLEGAQELDERPDAWQGKPARLLDLRLLVGLSSQDKKYVKDIESTAKVWVGTDGVPLAAETSMRMKGRALLVITFEQQARETFQFAKAGNRLVVLRHTQESSGSGGGEQGARKTVVTLQLK